MRRRLFVIAIGVGILAAPLVAEAQQSGKAARIGVLGAGVNPRSASFYAAFERRLRELGYIEGQNLAIHFRTPSKAEDLVQTADALVRQRPDVLVVVGPEASMKAARRATRTIPIVMVALNYDPIALGYVESLARPGGNITGLFFRSPELAAKQLELLRDALPRAEAIAMLWEAAASDQMRSAAAAAVSLGVRLQTVEVRPPYDFEAAFTLVLRSRAAGVLVVGGPMFFRERGKIADLALKHRLPTMSGAFPDLRYTMGYGPSLDEALRRAGDYVDKILKGARPSDLPVEQPTKFELLINLKTARELGLTIPSSLLLRADQVIE